MSSNCSKFPNQFQICEGLDSVPKSSNGTVVAIGNFDGVHQGHCAVLEDALSESDRTNNTALVMTFEPHPRTVFRPEHPVFRLTPVEAKSDLICALGFDGIWIIPFNKVFADLSADDFVNQFLIEKLKIKHATIGYDFHFGKNRQGTPDYLLKQGDLNGFSVSVIAPFEDDRAEIVSSSKIREALSAGDINVANQMLGYRWFLDSEVMHGEKRGRELGFPTANLHLPEEYRLQFGIYSVRVFLHGKRYDGVASFGRRPMFDNGQPVFEVFIFDFTGDIYGETIRVAICSYLRSEQKFAKIDDLVAQMNIDVQNAKTDLAELQPLSKLETDLEKISVIK